MDFTILHAHSKVGSESLSMKMFYGVYRPLVEYITMGYKFFDHTADVLFEAEGNDLDELFEACGLATEETQVDLKDIKPKVKKEISIEKDNVEMLLFDFLQELIFLKDAELLLFSKISVIVSEKNRKYQLKAVLEGEKIDPKKQELKVDVKAVTLHRFEVKKTSKGWFARVILDI